MQRVVAGAGLRLGRLGQQQLVADRGDEVDLDVDLVLLRPGLALLAQHSLPAGTQWSQKPTDSLPAARPVRMCTSGNAAVTAPSLIASRRDIRLPQMSFFGPPMWFAAAPTASTNAVRRYQLQRAKPSSSSCAQAMTCGIAWPCLMRAIIWLWMPRL